MTLSVWGSLSGSAASPCARPLQVPAQTQPETIPDRGSTEVMTKPAETLFLTQNIRIVSTVQLLGSCRALSGPQQAQEGTEQSLGWRSSSRQEQWAALGASQPGRHMRSTAPSIRTEKLGLITFNVTKIIRIQLSFHWQTDLCGFVVTINNKAMIVNYGC